MATIDKNKVRAALKNLTKVRTSSHVPPTTKFPNMNQPDNKTSGNQASTSRNTTSNARYTNNNKYQDINDINISVSRSASRWEDAHFKSIKIFDVDQLSDDDCVLFGKAVAQAISRDEITSDIIFMMLYLAVSCKSTLDIEQRLLTKPPGMDSMISATKPLVESAENPGLNDSDPLIDDIFGTSSTSTSQASKKKKSKGNRGAAYVEKMTAAARSGPKQTTTTETDKKFMAAAYSYLSAFLMRLQCRNPDEKTLEAVEKAKTRYTGFYDSGRSVLDEFDITTESMKSIRDVLARKPEVTSTWVAWVAYNENESTFVKQDFGLLEYLATQVFAYQGMHVVTQTLAIHQLTAIPIGLLLREMDCQMTRAAVTEIYDIVKNYHKNEEHLTRKTYYRYSRVWNEGYFSKVQSKSCTQLLYLAAKIAKDLGHNTNSDPTKIHAIKDLADSAKDRLNKVADNIVEFIWAQADEDEEAGQAWKNTDM
ncbi:TPA_asm: N [Artemisia alphacytorhabdovirus 2]|nr:TPA_asm: N [Artemisia alphacytorhabdovirus 2]